MPSSAPSNSRGSGPPWSPPALDGQHEPIAPNASSVPNRHHHAPRHTSRDTGARALARRSGRAASHFAAFDATPAGVRPTAGDTHRQPVHRPPRRPRCIHHDLGVDRVQSFTAAEIAGLSADDAIDSVEDNQLHRVGAPEGGGVGGVHECASVVDRRPPAPTMSPGAPSESKALAIEGRVSLIHSRRMSTRWQRFRHQPPSTPAACASSSGGSNRMLRECPVPALPR